MPATSACLEVLREATAPSPPAALAVVYDAAKRREDRRAARRQRKLDARGNRREVQGRPSQAMRPSAPKRGRKAGHILDSETDEDLHFGLFD